MWTYIINLISVNSFCIVNHNGAGNILLFHFYGLTLIYLTGPLSQVVQLKCDIYIYIKICVRGRDRHIPFFFLLGVLHISVWTESWEKREELIDPSLSDRHAPGEQLGEHQWQD